MVRTMLLTCAVLSAVVLGGGWRLTAQAAPAIVAQPGCSETPAKAGDDKAAEGEECSPSIDRAIATAKMNAALAYSAYLDGKGSRATADAYESWLRALTGEQARPIVPLGDSSVRGTSNIQRFFWPYEQINSNYCGPATAMTILRFLGPSTSKTANKQGVRDQLTGVPETDQEIPATPSWLGAARNGQTSGGGE